jgi:transglutaminase-like putative cysteine protease
MAQLARAAANDSAISHLAHQLGSVAAIESWTRRNFVYRDEFEEIVRTPEFMLADMGRLDNGRVVGLEGDCDDASTFIAALAKALGYPVRFVAIRYHSDSPNFEHVFPQVYDGAHWMVVDVTVSPETRIEWLEQMTEDV